MGDADTVHFINTLGSLITSKDTGVNMQHSGSQTLGQDTRLGHCRY